MAHLGYARLESDLLIDPGGGIPDRLPPPVYDRLFPTHVEFCAVSQFRRRDGVGGGVAGHAVMYLHGVGPDPEAPRTRLRLVAGAEAGGAVVGVGVSVNRWFKNANWIAIPGRELFFDGGLEPGVALSEARRDAVVERALALGLYAGIELHDYPSDDPQRSLRDFVLRHSLGTDFGIGLARSVFSTRVPVTPAMMQEIVTFLNDLNEQYAHGTVEYEWSGIEDNCVHAVHNALAAASIWRPRSVRAIRLRKLLNVAIPANAFLMLALRTAEFPIEAFEAVWRDACAHDSLLEFGWLPGHHGALLSTRGVRRPNALYDTALHLFLLEGPLGGRRVRRAEALLRDARFLDLDANLRWFEERYRSILARRPRDEGALLRGDRRRAVRRAYHEYVERQLADVVAKRALL